MPSSYNSTLPADVLLDTAILKADLTTAGTLELIGGTRGGFTFSPGINVRNIEYDGKRSEHITGMGRITAYNATMSGTLIVFNAKVLRFLSAGATGATNAVTLPEAGAVLPLAVYHKWQLLYSRGDGGTVAIDFPYGLVTEYTITGADNNEAEVSITIAAAQRRDDASSTDGEVPFTITVTPGA